MFSKKTVTQLVTLSTLAILASCNGGGGTGGGYGTGGGTTGSTYGTYQSPYASALEFVNGLNSIESYGKDASYVELYEDETYRSQVIGQDEWFVIYDDKYNEYKAVSLQYIRSIVYYDYYSNSSGMASEFRAIENDDIVSGEMNGDYWGDDYEVVDYDYITNSYWGRNSGYEYEDGVETSDVSLKTAEQQQKAFITKAAKISYHFNVGIETSLSLVTLGQKMEKVVGKSNSELTAQDQQAFASDLTRLTGASLADVMAASKDASAKDALVEKIADKIGTTPANLENKLLPELLGVNL
jgi:hypothetical protein